MNRKSDFLDSGKKQNAGNAECGMPCGMPGIGNAECPKPESRKGACQEVEGGRLYQKKKKKKNCSSPLDFFFFFFLMSALVMAVGDRVAIDGQYGFIRYIGLVPPTIGICYFMFF